MPTVPSRIHNTVDKTCTTDTPWTLLVASDKYVARFKVLKTIIDRLKAEL